MQRMFNSNVSFEKKTQKLQVNDDNCENVAILLKVQNNTSDGAGKLPGWQLDEMTLVVGMQLTCIRALLTILQQGSKKTWISACPWTSSSQIVPPL